jgi:hypothetical protein
VTGAAAQEHASAGTSRHRRPLTPLEEMAMAQLAHNVIQHDFRFPRIARAEDAEMAALYAILVSLAPLENQLARRIHA